MKYDSYTQIVEQIILALSNEDYRHFTIEEIHRLLPQYTTKDIKIALTEFYDSDLFNLEPVALSRDHAEDTFMLTPAAFRLVAKHKTQPIKHYISKNNWKETRKVLAQVLPWVLTAGTIVVAILNWQTAQKATANRRQLESVEQRLNTLSNVNRSLTVQIDTLTNRVQRLSK